MDKIEAAGGMYEAVGTGLVQAMIGQSALAAQERIETGAEKVIGVNCYQDDDDGVEQPEPYRPDRQAMEAHVKAFKAFKADRSQATVDKAIAGLREAANDERLNTFEKVVDAAAVGVTHGEIIGTLREELGFGQPLIVA